MRIHITIPLLATAALALAPAVASAATPAPPVVKEIFTPLPCGGTPANRTTIQMEGCAEQQILARDKTIDQLNARVFARLSSASAQRGFVASNTQWVAFRRSFCATAADRFAGGTQAPVVAAQCSAQLGLEHITDLRTLLQDG